MDRNSILASKTIVTEPVEVSPWGGTVYIKSLNGVERVQFYEQVGRLAKDGEDGPERTTRIALLLVIFALCDEHGNRILQPEDVDELAKHNGELLNGLCAVANRLNKIGDDAKKK